MVLIAGNRLDLELATSEADDQSSLIPTDVEHRRSDQARGMEIAEQVEESISGNDVAVYDHEERASGRAIRGLDRGQELIDLTVDLGIHQFGEVTGGRRRECPLAGGEYLDHEALVAAIGLGRLGSAVARHGVA